MTRPKLQVNEVFVLQEVQAYEGGMILGVFFTLPAAMASRSDVKKDSWRHPEPGTWTTARGYDDLNAFYLITQHTVRTK